MASTHTLFMSLQELEKRLFEIKDFNGIEQRIQFVSASMPHSSLLQNLLQQQRFITKLRKSIIHRVNTIIMRLESTEEFVFLDNLEKPYLCEKIDGLWWLLLLHHTKSHWMKYRPIQDVELWKAYERRTINSSNDYINHYQKSEA